MYINKTTLQYYCQRCGYKGVLNIELAQKVNFFVMQEPKKPYLADIQLYGLPYSDRPTTVPKKSAYYQNTFWDAFDLKQPNGEITGVHLRKMNPKGSFTQTAPNVPKGLLYASNRLTSALESPIVVVEGVYDCVGSNDAAVVGAIRSSVVEKYFSGHYIELRPDGDIWQDPEKRLLMIKSIKSLLKNNTLYLKGIQVIMVGKDIDEIDISKELFYVDRDSIHIFLKMIG